jgi:hypothetical protein
MLVELAVAGVVTGTLLLVCVPLISGTLAQRKSIDRRQIALFELENVMENVTARDWDDLTPSILGKIEIAAWAKRQLPGAELKIDVSQVSEKPIGKRITAAIHWTDSGGRPIAPISLTTWRFKTYHDVKVPVK